MSTDLHASFTELYVNVTTKMKKRFMRKPTVSAATNEFVALAIQYELISQHLLESVTSAAKCEASVSNFLVEAEHFISAAIGCFIQAINKYPEKSPIRAPILMKLAGDLVSLGYKLKAMCYYKQALEIIEHKTLCMMCLRNLLNMQIDCEKVYMALETANRM